MKQFAKVSLFFLHLIGVALCLVCTVISVDRVITLIPRYTPLGGWLSHLETDPMHVLTLTTWSLALAALPAMILFCLDSPRKQQRLGRRFVHPQPSRSLPEEQDELVISWIGEDASREDVQLAGLPSQLAR